MNFIKMLMELPGEKRSQDVIEAEEWNSLWKQTVTQGNHSENYLHELYDYLFNDEKGWVYKVQAELDGVQPYLEGVMTQPVGKAPDGSLWTYPSTESGTVPWGNIMGDITEQQDLIQKFDTKSDVGHKHFGMDLILKNGDIPGFVLLDDSIPEAAYKAQSVSTRTLENLSVTSEKLNNGAVTSAKIASGAVINDSIANGSVSGVKIASKTITREKLTQDALYSPIKAITADRNIEVDDLGKTLRPVYSSSNTTFTLTLNAASSEALPIGAEIAACRAYTSNKVNITFSGVRVVYLVGGRIADKDNNVTVTIPDVGGMLAIKKIEVSSSYGDMWLLTGNAEVVS